MIDISLVYRRLGDAELPTQIPHSLYSVRNAFFSPLRPSHHAKRGFAGVGSVIAGLVIPAICLTGETALGVCCVDD